MKIHRKPQKSIHQIGSAPSPKAAPGELGPVLCPFVAAEVAGCLKDPEVKGAGAELGRSLFLFWGGFFMDVEQTRRFFIYFFLRKVRMIFEGFLWCSIDVLVFFFFGMIDFSWFSAGFLGLSVFFCSLGLDCLFQGLFGVNVSQANPGGILMVDVGQVAITLSGCFCMFACVRFFSLSEKLPFLKNKSMADEWGLPSVPLWLQKT